jgi:hypothetical protein
MRRAAVLALVLLLVTRPASGLAATGTLDYVYDYNDANKQAYSIERAGARIEIAPMLPLQPGDRIEVKSTGAPAKGPATYVALAIGRQTVTLRAGSPPYCVGAPDGDCSKRTQAAASNSPGPPSYVVNALHYLASVLAGPHDDELADATESMLSRGPHGSPPVHIPLLAHKGQRLAAGTRAVALEWEGGTPPFDVALYRNGVAAPVATQRVDARSVVMPALTLEPGTYRFEIVDRQKQSALGEFLAVAPDERPAPSADDAAALADPSLTPDVRTTLEAAFLARADADWDFEAYERVAPIAASSPPAELLRYRLVEGD